MGTLFSLSKSATSDCLDISEIALLLFGVLLVVGIVGEYAKSERWKKHLLIFEMLVTIGVAGELLADGGIFLFSRHLQTIADQEIADLTSKLGNAKTLAEAAATASSNAQSLAKQANDEAGQAQRKADDAKASAGGAVTMSSRAENSARNAGILVAQVAKQAEELKQQLEKERATREELEKSLAWRGISTTNLTRDELALFAGQKVVVVAVADSESWRLAGYMHAMMRFAKWNVLSMTRTLEPIQDGVVIWVRSPMEQHFADVPQWRAATVLAAQLEDNHVATLRYPTRAKWWEGVPDDAIYMQIGLKPQPYFEEKAEEELEKTLPPQVQEQMHRFPKVNREIELRLLQDELRRYLEVQRRLLETKPN